MSDIRRHDIHEVRHIKLHNVQRARHVTCSYFTQDMRVQSPLNDVAPISAMPHRGGAWGKWRAPLPGAVRR
jgi:hypothetical protein